MYLLILYAFLHRDVPAEHVVVGHFPTAEACQAAADRANVQGVNSPSRQLGDVFICARIQFPT